MLYVKLLFILLLVCKVWCMWASSEMSVHRFRGKGRLSHCLQFFEDLEQQPRWHGLRGGCGPAGLSEKVGLTRRLWGHPGRVRPWAGGRQQQRPRPPWQDHGWGGLQWHALRGGCPDPLWPPDKVFVGKAANAQRWVWESFAEKAHVGPSQRQTWFNRQIHQKFCIAAQNQNRVSCFGITCACVCVCVFIVCWCFRNTTTCQMWINA